MQPSTQPIAAMTPETVAIDRDLLALILDDASNFAARVSHARAQHITKRIVEAQALLDAGAGATCDSCQFWELHAAGFGACRRVNHKQEGASTWFQVHEYEDDTGWLKTGPKFGCIHHEQLGRGGE